MEFNSCFICLKELAEVKGLAGPAAAPKAEGIIIINKKRSQKLAKFLIAYLLSSPDNRYGHVLKTVLKFSGAQEVVVGEICKGIGDWEEDEYSAEIFAKFCGRCEVAAEGIRELQLELERLQKKIREEVRTVREAVLRSSGWLGGISSGGSNETEALANFSRKFCNGGESWKAKEIFEVLKSFQRAVNEKDNDSFLHEDCRLIVKDEDCEASERSESPRSVENEDAISVADIVEEGHMDSNEEEVIPNADPLLLHQDAEFIDDHSSSSFYAAESETDSDDDDDDSDDIMIMEEVKKAEEIPSKSVSSSSSLAISEQHHQNRSREKPEPIKVTAQSDCGTMAYQVIIAQEGKQRETEQTSSSNPNNPPSKTIYDLLPKARLERIMKRREKYNRSPSHKIPKRSFTCETCSVKFTNSTRFEDHLRGHETPDKQYSCSKCQEQFSNLQLFQFHSDRHTKAISLKCDVCQKYVPKPDITNHMKSHVDQVFPCSHCGHCLSSLKVYVLHIHRDHGELTDLECHICGEMLQRKNELLKHLANEHEAIEKYCCDVEGCDKSFLLADHLRKHKEVHSRASSFLCPECGKTFGSKPALEGHNLLHTGETKFNCDQCPQGFRQSSALQTHQIVEHGAPKLKCEQCGKECTSSSGLSYHVKLEHGTGTFCHICNKKCASTAKLRTHMESHSETRDYICDECGKSFLTMASWKTHKKTHGKKNVKCPHCPKAFTSKQILTAHLRIHTGERPYLCDHCGKSFNQQGARNVHRKRCPHNASK